MVDNVLVEFHTNSLSATGDLLYRFVQPALVHHQLLLGPHPSTLTELLYPFHGNYDQSVAFQKWAQNFLWLSSASQHDSLMVLQHSQTLVDVIHTSLLNYVQDCLHTYGVGYAT
ncbi:hypothetical protein DSO57_1024050 [Entomophthora muscae]|uniref:Uncharacterized protein n=1 Tax=Entomophthora muscae TaxID=34485 RepID=A0ACC2RHA7_9FUNG|nr:hypothetical protein DSO57_1024050 [Entomophthora muscae]